MGAAQVIFGEVPGIGGGLLSLLFQTVRKVYCPEDNVGFTTFGGLISHLNDAHAWPRQKIADHLETYGL